MSLPYSILIPGRGRSRRDAFRFQPGDVLLLLFSNENEMESLAADRVLVGLNRQYLMPLYHFLALTICNEVADLQGQAMRELQIAVG